MFRNKPRSFGAEPGDAIVNMGSSGGGCLVPHGDNRPPTEKSQTAIGFLRNTE